LNTAGYGTFTVDSFTGRGTFSPADVRIPFGTRTIDAYRALQVLAKHPGVDPARIVLMGFSHGGHAALYGNTERFQKQYGSPDLEYAAYISVYGICITRFRGDEGLTKPLLMLHGVADDWVPEASAASMKRGYRRLAEGKPHRVRGRTSCVRRAVLPAEVKVPDSNSVTNCSLEEGENGASSPSRRKTSAA
jgi:dienelactone hydrolase